MKANDPKGRMAKEPHQNLELRIDETCRTLAISKATFYRYLALAQSDRQ